MAEDNDQTTVNTEVDAKPTTKAPVEVAEKKAPAKEALTASRAASILGLRKSDILNYNSGTSTVVTAQGGKYSINRSGKAVRHISGPRLTDIADGVEYSDARGSGSPFVGTAAQINSSANEGQTRTETLEQTRERLVAELADVDKELEDI